MRNIIVSMRVTLDGFITGPNGEMDWMEEFLSVVSLSGCFRERQASLSRHLAQGEAFAVEHQDASFRGGGTLLPADKGMMEYLLISSGEALEDAITKVV